MSLFETFKSFIHASPTSVFSAQKIEKALQEKGYISLDSVKTPEKGLNYYFKHDGMIGAFSLPKHLTIARYLLSHTDSPCLKLKPKPLVTLNQMSFLKCEPYGSPLLSSYLGEPLALAGQIIVDDEGTLKKQLIHTEAPIALIPDPAIHLTKEANATLEKGMLQALVNGGPIDSLETFLGIKHPILAHDLYLVSASSLIKMGSSEPFIAGPRLDNLSSSFAILQALSSMPSSDSILKAALFFDHEEIGSLTLSGAQSHLLSRKLEAIWALYPEAKGALHEAYSLDVAHANHPSYSDKFDTDHPITLGGGLVIKHHAAHRYAQNLELFARCKTMGLPHQTFTMRNEVGTGSTLGPYFATLYGIPTQDIGIGILGMHSTHEILAEKDLETLIQFAKRFLA